jgi:hypothetical protein
MYIQKVGDLQTSNLQTHYINSGWTLGCVLDGRVGHSHRQKSSWEGRHRGHSPGQGQWKAHRPLQSDVERERSAQCELPIQLLVHTADLPNWRAQWDIWPRDIPIRRNMSSSGWFDLYNGILSNEVFIFDEKGPSRRTRSRSSSTRAKER